MWRKSIVASICLVILTTGVYAQSALDQLSTDLQTIFEELGEEIVPNLQTASVLNHGLGSAELGSFPRMYVSLSTGATVAPGVLEFTDDEAKFENFALINTFLDEAGLNDSSVRDVTDNYAPYPSMRATLGIGLVGGYEIDVQLGLVPAAASGLIPVDGAEAAITTIGTRLRKVLVKQQDGIPAISVGLGYVFSMIDFSYDLEEVDPITTGSGASETTLDLNGDITFEAQTHSIGLDVRASTRFLRVTYPFIGVSGYFQRSTYRAGADDFSANVNNAADPTAPSVEPLSEQDFNDFNVVINAGSDIKLAILNIFLHLNYAVDTRAYGGILGMRIHI